MGAALLSAEPLALSWRAPAECSARAGALEQLHTLLPSLPAELPESSADPQTLRIEVQIEARAGVYQAELSFLGPLGEDRRVIESERCELLVSGALLVIAVTVDPVLVATELLPPEPAQPVAVQEPRSVEEPEPKPEFSWMGELEAVPPAEQLAPVLPAPSRPSVAPRLGFHAALLGGGGYGPLRAGSAALSLDLGLHGPSWRGSLRALWSAPATMEIADVGAMRSQAWILGARACGVPSLGLARLELPLCGGLEAGAMRARGVGDTPNPRTATTPWLALSAGLGLRYAPLSRLALALDLDLLAPLLRGGFTIGDVLVQRYTPAGVRALAGLELRLP